MYLRDCCLIVPCEFHTVQTKIFSILAPSPIIIFTETHVGLHPQWSCSYSLKNVGAITVYSAREAYPIYDTPGLHEITYLGKRPGFHISSWYFICDFLCKNNQRLLWQWYSDHNYIYNWKCTIKKWMPAKVEKSVWIEFVCVRVFLGFTRPPQSTLLTDYVRS